MTIKRERWEYIYLNHLYFDELIVHYLILPPSSNICHFDFFYQLLSLVLFKTKFIRNMSLLLPAVGKTENRTASTIIQV
jgi:hypothetical protein